MDLLLYENLKNIPKILMCDKCNKEFLLSDISIKETEIAMPDKVHILFRYFECPHCGELFTVSIDTLETIALSKKLQATIKRAECLHGTVKAEKYTKKAIKLREKLIKQHSELRNRYNGKFYRKSAK